ncbi:MAG: hemolysin III family protein [Actinomycetes bacterium]|jgi:hemolysin III
MTIAPPKLRGWFHLGASPVVFIASLLLFIFTKNSLKWAVALYSLSAITLFSVSAIYHRVPWAPAKKKIWRRWDHANINFLIAGSYTPFAMTLLHGRDRTILMSVVWTGAIIGVLVRIFWLGAPRWFYVVNYLLLGWVAVAYLPAIYRTGGLWVLIPIILGGIFYSIGAIFYALKFPGPQARYFGFHELFHVFVIAAWAVQYLAISIAIYRA